MKIQHHAVLNKLLIKKQPENEISSTKQALLEKSSILRKTNTDNATFDSSRRAKNKTNGWTGQHEAQNNIYENSGATVE